MLNAMHYTPYTIHVLALLSFQQPTFQQFTWNQMGIDLQMPWLYWKNMIDGFFEVKFRNVGCLK